MPRQDSAKCPECGEMIDMEEFSEVGDIIYCPHCDVELKVVRIDPPKLKVAEELEPGTEEYEEDTDADIPGGET